MRAYKKYIFLALLFLFPILLLLIFQSGQHRYRLNILTNNDIKKLQVYNPKSMQCLHEDTDSIHKIPHFSFTNQNNEFVSRADLEGQIYVAGFFFTTCPGICIDMTKELLRVQEAFKVRKDFKILYHTVNPRYDSVSVLKEYAQNRNINDAIWYLLTGKKSEIYDLARCGYFVAANKEVKNEEGQSDFIHTDKFILVDAKGQIRGFYTGTDREDVDRLITEIQILMLEENQNS